MCLIVPDEVSHSLIKGCPPLFGAHDNAVWVQAIHGGGNDYPHHVHVRPRRQISVHTMPFHNRLVQLLYRQTWYHYLVLVALSTHGVQSHSHPPYRYTGGEASPGQIRFMLREHLKQGKPIMNKYRMA